MLGRSSRVVVAVGMAVAAVESASVPGLAGTLSITAPASTTLPATAISPGTLTAGVNAANWGDTAGSNVGWNGTIAVQRFHITGTNAWVPGASHLLANNNSGQYTGGSAAAAYTVTVTAASLAAAATVSI